MPQVSLFGRPNVGKSALFNALIGEDISLVYDRPGVTRDHIAQDVFWNGHRITLVDTGGLGYDPDGTLDQAVCREAQIAAESSDLVLWVLDAREGLMPSDLDLYSWLRRHASKVLYIANKVDTPKNETLLADFSSLGVNKIFPVSAEHKRGLNELKREIMHALGLPEQINKLESKPTSLITLTTARIALVGRPNVGKSSLTNALLGQQRTIVNDLAGTTRDAVEIPLPDFSLPGLKVPVALVDTAGMRARASIRDPLERQMTARTVHTINRAHIILHILEAQSGVTVQDKKISGLIHTANRASIIVVNKWDLARAVGTYDSETTLQQHYIRSLRDALFFQAHAPVVFLSALEQKGLEELRQTIARLAYNLASDIPTGPLNRIIQEHTQTHPPPLRGRSRFKILYTSARKATARDTTPCTDTQLLAPPRLITFCNHRELLDSRWLAALEKKIRAHFPLDGVPLRWEFRDRATQKQPSSA